MMTSHTTYRILIVEDNPGDLALIGDFLYGQLDAPVLVHALTCQETQSLLTSDAEFDIILLDLSLPDRTGEPLIRDIIALAADIPVIVLTGYADLAFGVRSLTLGIADYILKDELTPVALHRSIVLNFERGKIASALKESEKKYSDLFNLNPLPMWVVDLLSLKFLDVNQATIDHYGYTREEFLTMTLKDIRPEAEIDKLEQALETDGQHPGENAQRVMVHQLKGGELRNVEVQIAPILYQGTKANMVIATDITERLKYIQAVEDQNEQLKEISWIQSHVIRAPLSRVMGLISLIKDKTLDSDEQDLMLDYLVRSADELDEVIRNITEKTRVADYKQLRK